MTAKSFNVGLTVGNVDVSRRVLDTIGVIPSLDFLSKCKVVSDRLGFIVRALDTVAEVCFKSPSKKMPSLNHCFVGSPICQDCLECDLIYSNGGYLSEDFRTLNFLQGNGA